jgi:hypothetical protein
MQMMTALTMVTAKMITDVVEGSDTARQQFVQIVINNENVDQGERERESEADRDGRR